MDGRRQITVKANGGQLVDAAAGFYVEARHNPGVHGAVLSDALASRFSAQIQVSTFSGLGARASPKSGALVAPTDSLERPPELCAVYLRAVSG